MLQLVYPVEDYAPMIPSRTAGDADREVLSSGADDRMDLEEYFPVVDEAGIVKGMATRWYCHSGAKVLHPVVHLHIINRNGEIYLQKRSKKKKIQPGRWDTAVGGHVVYGESIHESLFRESGEELGFTEYNPIHIATYSFESEIEKELVSVFAAVGNFVLTPDRDEVDEGRFWTYDEIDSHLEDGTFTPNFLSEFSQIRDRLKSLL